MNLRKKFEQWPEPYQPPFWQIKEIGCCPEHESDFDWYRQHTWQDLRDLILSTEEILDYKLDPVEFGSLEPNAHRYFMKGVLSALAEKSQKYKDFDEVDDWDWDWVTSVTFAPYSKEEVENIVELLEYIQKKFTLDLQGLHYDSDKEIRKSVDDWKNYLSKFE